MSTFVLDPNVNLTSSVPRVVRNFQRRQYKDKEYAGGEVEWKKRLETSTTVYVGNLSCYTTEYQLYELFGRCGSIKRIIMGLDKIKKTPCGFCFVEFDERDAAIKAINYLNKTKIDGRDVNVDIDAGFKEGRQYGRGAHGGQVGDERRQAREQASATAVPATGGSVGASHMFTRSITIVACLTMISLILVATSVDSIPIDVNERNHTRPVGFKFNRISASFANPLFIRQAQLSQQREQFEKAFAQFLVTLLKTAKPTLLKAFIQATLADKQLKESAIALFFNNTGSNSDDS